VLLPARRSEGAHRLRTWSLSAAAGIAAVAMVAWMARPMLSPEPVQVASQPAAVTTATSPLAADASRASSVENYLLAHQPYSTTSAMQGVAPYVRTVSHEPQGRR
jgi:hypothetical protein